MKAKHQKSATKVMISIYSSRAKVAAIPLDSSQTVTAKCYTENCLPKVLKNLLENRTNEELHPSLFSSDLAPCD